MVGLVIVSHSRVLSRSLADLVRRVTRQELPLAAAGGSGEDHADFGTDAMDILGAVESVYRPDGVVVLMDLGSAVLSAETALAFLGDEKRTNVRLCSAPLVEGAVAAGVQIGLGSDLDTICREATRGLAAKRQHLDAPDTRPPADSSPSTQQHDGQAWQEIRLTVKTAHGLHARPAARLVQIAGSFDADVRIRKAGTGQPPAPADSFSRITLLDVAWGDEIVVGATGPEADQALAAIRDIVKNAAEEDGRASRPATVSVPEITRGEKGIKLLAISPGIAVGPLFPYRPPVPAVPRHRTTNPEKEWTQLQNALAQVIRAVEKRHRETLQQLGPSEAAIFEAHRLMLEDPLLLAQAHREVFEKRHNAALAWQNSVQGIVAGYDKLCDDYQRQRVADVQDMGRQVLLALIGQPVSGKIDLHAPAILAAQDLSPADLAGISPGRLLALVTVAGGSASHSAIMARSMGVPAVAGVPASFLRLPPGTHVAVDGFNGRLWIDPPADIVDDLAEKRRQWLAKQQRSHDVERQPAVTADGRHVRVTANAGSASESRAASENGAEGIGLLRTEFIYLSSPEPPDEETQVTILQRIGAVMGNQPVCVRTLDAGGDKPLPFLNTAPEDNPFLGVRGVRLSLAHPDLLHIQLRAVLRAAAAWRLKLMFPMISTVEEVEQCLERVDVARRQLEKENIDHGWPLPVGIMIETPAAALLMPELAGRLDFFSVGTNDLTQYTLAAERGNPTLAAYADALHPAVLRLVRQVLECAHGHGKPVSVCGELAADPVAVPILLGLGVDELSVVPAAVTDVRDLIRRLDNRRCQALTAEALNCDRATQVRRLVETFTAGL